ncbi:MAG: hypothetical protein JJU29_13715 [Verrucomicrobia bacterium]|nr:hypothetical protein [Verrucomicrobiota bacterium]MCH8512725.1 hypothetical protein [Kiritimatiellia bacterium]
MNRLHPMFACVFLLGSVIRADTFPLPQKGAQLRIHLEGLLSQNPDTPARTLVLEFNHWQDHWFMGSGYSPSYNQGIHRAILTPKHADDLERLEVDAILAGDAWVPGGDAQFRIEWHPDGENRYRGRYTGTALGRDVSGVATGVYFPAPEPLSHAAARRGEHPRLLFRAGDLPALREKADTEFGRRALARFPESAVGLGVLYQLKEDAAYADRAREAVAAHMADFDSGDKSIRHRFWGYRLEQVALAYDLCYHAWPEDFREEVHQYMMTVSRRMFRERGEWTQYMVWRPDSAYNAATHYSGVIALLAMADTPGAAPEAPAKPEIPALSPRETTGNAAVPLVAYESGLLPARILYSGPMSDAQIEPWMEAQGDFDSLGIDPGDWRLMERKPDVRGMVRNRHTQNEWTVDVNPASDTAFDSWNVFTAAWEIEEAGIYLYQSHHGGVTTFLNGVRLDPKVALRLDPGIYEVAVGARFGRPNPWAGFFVRPTLERIDAEEADALLTEENRIHERDGKFHARLLADWETSGGVDPEVMALARDGLSWFHRYEEKVFGDRGSQVGSTHILALEGPALMASVYRNVTARPLAHRNGISMFLPRRIMALSFGADGEWTGQGFWGSYDFQTRGYQDRRDIGRSILATLFPSVPETYQPVVWWFWQTMGDPLAGESVARADRLVERGVEGGSYNSVPVYAFLHAPVGMEPEAPAEAMPLYWHDAVTGDVILRDRWQDTGDIVLQLTAQQRKGHVSFSKAGAFALRGLGYDWTGTNYFHMRRMGDRMGEAVLQSLHPDINRSATGTLLSAEFSDNGSAVLKMDLSEVYYHLQRDEKGVTETYDRTGTPYPDAFARAGEEVSVIRSLLVDTGGRAGVPLVMVIHDRFKGVDTPLWTWPIRTENVPNPGGEAVHPENAYARNPARDGRVEVADAVFTLRQGEAQLRGTFLNPDPVSVALEDIHRITSGSGALRHRVISAQGPAGESSGEFLAVVTLGEGSPPPVTRFDHPDGIGIQVGDARYLLAGGDLRFLLE